MARDQAAATKLARDLPKFGEVVRARGGWLKTMGGNVGVWRLDWDFSSQSTNEQVFRMEGHVTIDGIPHRVETFVSKQALEHFLRAV